MLDVMGALPRSLPKDETEDELGPAVNASSQFSFTGFVTVG